MALKSRLWLLWLVCCLLGLFGSAQQAQAANYTFPGALPAGCTGVAGVYNCAAGLTLNTGDTVTIAAPTPATITAPSMSTNGAQINVGGSAANLNLTINGTLTVGTGAKLVATINAQQVDNNLGGATFIGNTTIMSGSGGYVWLGPNSTQTGNVTANGGNIDMRRGASVSGNLSCSCNVYIYAGDSVGGTINGLSMNSSDGASTFGGSITVTTGSITLGVGSTVTGSLSTTGGGLYLNGSNTVSGTLTANTGDIYYSRPGASSGTTTGAVSCSCNVYVYAGSSIQGTLNAASMNSSDGASTFGGSITTTNNTIVGTGSSVAGSVNSTSGAIDLNGSNAVTGAVTSNTGTIRLLTAGASSTSVSSISCNCNTYVYGGNTVLGAVNVLAFDASNAAVTIGGAITTSNGIWLAASTTVAGSLTSNTGNVVLYAGTLITGGITCNCNTYVYASSSVPGDVNVLYLDASNGAATFGGAITTSNGILLGAGSTTGGSLTSVTGNIILYGNNTVNGGISCACYLNTYPTISISGGVTVNTIATTNGGNNVIYGGSVHTLTSDLNLGSGGQILGDAIADHGHIYLQSSSSVLQCVRPKTGSAYMYSASTIGGVCCGAGASCTNTCLTNSSGGANPPLCSSTIPATVAEYKFNEFGWNGSSGEVSDTSGNGWDAKAASLSTTKPTTANTTPVVSGSTGTCYYGVFNRTNKDYVTLPTGFPHLGDKGSFTVTAWIKTTDITQAGQRIFSDDENGYTGQTTGYALTLGDAGAGRVRLITRATTAGSTTLDTAAVITNNTWYFVAFVLDSTAKIKYLYVYNTAGTQLAAVQSSYTEANLGVATGTLSIGGETNSALGSENTSSYGFAGNIDEVRVYPEALSVAEVSTVRGLTSSCAAPATLVAQYHFEELSWNGTAGEIKDSAGYAGGPFNGKSQGSPLATPITTAPLARSGTTGTCGYASMPGPTSAGASMLFSGLPVSTTAGAVNSASMWIYWDGTPNVFVLAMGKLAVKITSTSIGFRTSSTSSSTDLYGAAHNFTANTWYHLAVVITNGSLSASKIYINGASLTLSQITGSATLANVLASSTMYVGGWASNTSYRFMGKLDEVRVFTGALTPANVTQLYTQTHLCPNAIDHLEIRHASGTGVTCAPSTLTVYACQNAACTTSYTGGITGTLTATGSVTANWPNGAAFNIASGSSSVGVNMQVVGAGSVVVGTSGLSITPTSGTTCNFGSPSCTFTAADSGLVFNVPNHVADVAQTVSVSAVRKSDNASMCVPAFASVSKSVTFKCAYVNPGTGTLPVRVGGSALNSGNNTAAACDATGRAVSLSFDASGNASTTVQYADAGQMTLSAVYAGSGADAGLSMTGSDGFITAPASFAFSGVTAAPIVAGNVFSATVTAKNNSGTVTPNFGKETAPEGVGLVFGKYQPTGTGASAGTFTGTGIGSSLSGFNNGAVTVSDLKWTEVGSGNLTANLSSASYLGTGMNVTGTTGSTGQVGRFIPHHFDVAVSQGCGGFTYSGQPFTASITARNASGGTTVNYDGTASTSPNFSKSVTLSAATNAGTGTMSNTAVSASNFGAGVATVASPAFTFNTKLTATTAVNVRAVDTDSVSSATGAEGTISLRSGRIKVSNAFGSEKSNLAVPVQTQYWSGKAWVINSADNCTSVAAAAIPLSGYIDRKGATTNAWTTTPSAVTVAGGNGTLTLSAPTSSGTGSVDFAFNLGNSTTDQSCLSTPRPTSTAGNLPWLRAQNGSTYGCSGVVTYDRDPSARATFGVYSPETKKLVYVRDMY